MQTEALHEDTTLGDGLRVITIPASLPFMWVAIRAEELCGSTGADFQDGVNQQLQVNCWLCRSARGNVAWTS
jgi:hypothetical protein